MKINIWLTAIAVEARRRLVPLGSLVACLTLPLWLVSGCTATSGSSSSSLQREIDSLRMEVADLKASGRLSDMRGGGDVNSEITRLRGEVQRLSNSVEGPDGGGLTLSQQLDSLNARLDRLERRAGASSPGAGQTGSMADGGAYPTPRAQANTYQPPESAPGSTAGPVTANSTAPLPPSAGPYEEGKSLYDQKQFKAAIAKFKSYLASEPKGSQAAAAQFYIGESLYSQQQYEEAILEYQKVVQGFPKSNQVPYSLLKQGQAFQAINDKDSAKLLFQKVVRDFPKSTAASMASARLKSI